MNVGRLALFAFCSASLFAQAVDNDAVARAMSHFRENARSYGLVNPDQELRLRKARRDQLGASHLRFDQYHRGVPVFEGQAIAHVERNGNVWVTNALRANLNIDVNSGISRAAAIAAALRSMGVQGAHDVRVAELKVLPQGQRSFTDLLAWHVRIFVENEVEPTAQRDMFLDARSGAMLWSFDSLHTAGAVGIGRTMYSLDQNLNTNSTGTTFELRDTTKNNSFTTDMNNRRFVFFATIVTDTANDFGDNGKTNTDRDTAGADAHYGMMASWGYYQSKFGRNGIDGAGRQTSSRVHYSNNYANAFWDDGCFCMTYGDGSGSFYPLVSLDIAGHEMSHGVTSTEADLTYSGESGGLNESTSDIFGTAIEFANSNSLDQGDWWIGEMIYKANWPTPSSFVPTVALRYMDHPSKDGLSPNCWSSTIGGLDVHFSSGPSNHMFYLLANGGTSKCNGNVVGGIGINDAAAIWYKALTDLMTPSTNYHGARTAALSAAGTLFGNGSAQQNAVGAAFSAINVN